MREKETPQQTISPWSIDIIQPGIELHIKPQQNKLSPLEQALLKAYAYHILYPGDNGHQLQDHKITIEQLHHNIKPSINPVLDPHGDDVLCPPYTPDINNNVTLYKSAAIHLLDKLPIPFSNADFTDLIQKFYKSHHHEIGHNSARHYGSFYKNYFFKHGLIEVASSEDNGTETYRRTDKKHMNMPTKQDTTIDHDTLDQGHDACIDSIRQHIIQHQETNSGFTRGVLVLQLSESFNEEEIDKALAYMIRNHEIYQTSNTSFMPVQPVSRIIQNNTGEKTT